MEPLVSLEWRFELTKAVEAVDLNGGLNPLLVVFKGEDTLRKVKGFL